MDENNPPFEKGNSVRLIKGWTEMIVMECGWYSGAHPNSGKKFTGWWIRTLYFSRLAYGGEDDSSYWEKWRPVTDFVKWDDQIGRAA